MSEGYTLFGGQKNLFLAAVIANSQKSVSSFIRQLPNAACGCSYDSLPIFPGRELIVDATCFRVDSA